MFLRQFFLGFFFLVTSSFALSNTEFTYNVIDGGIEVTGCVETCPSDLVIPEEIDGLAVISIGEMAFFNNYLTSAIIPESVVTIKESAFALNQLETIFIPNSVIRVKEWAFALNKLENITISSSLGAIENATFMMNNLSILNIPESVTVIGRLAFADNNLSSIVIPNGIKKIGEGAFVGNQLTSVYIPDSLNTLNQSAFDDNPGIILGDWRIFLLPNVTTLLGCSGTCPKDLIIPNSINNLQIKRIAGYSFKEMQLTNVSIPNGITSIGPSAFYQNELDSLIIPNSVKIISESAFQHNKLTSLIIPDSIEKIGIQAFSNNQLTSLNIPASVSNIYDKAFSYNQITNLISSENAVGISDYAFADNINITSGSWTYILSSGNAEITGSLDDFADSLHIPNYIDGYVVTSIGASAFVGMGLTNVIIPNSVEKISEGAFADNQLTSVNLPDSLESIGDGAFERNYGLTSESWRYILLSGNAEITGCNGNCPSELEIPDSVDNYIVKSIGAFAFYGSDINSVTIPPSITNINRFAFFGNKLTDVNIPESVKSIGYRAFGKNELTSLAIPAGDLSIGINAFYNNNLESLYFHGEIPVFFDDFTSPFASNPLSSVSYCNNDNSELVIIEGIVPHLDERCQPDFDQITWDFDESGSVDALSDGLLLLRYAFGLREQSLTDDVLSHDSSLSPENVISNLEQAYQYADIDQSGSVDALSDGLILLRYFFGLRGDSLISGVISPNANRTSAADIEAYIESHMP